MYFLDLPRRLDSRPTCTVSPTHVRKRQYFSGNKNTYHTISTATSRKGIVLRLERAQRDFFVDLYKLSHFKDALHKCKVTAYYHNQRQKWTPNPEDTVSSTFTIVRAMPDVPDTRNKEFLDKLHQRLLPNNRHNDTISDFKDEKQISLYERDSTNKIPEKEKTKILNQEGVNKKLKLEKNQLQMKLESLKEEVKVEEEKILELKQKSTTERKSNDAIQKDVSLEPRIREYKIANENLQRKIKEQEDISFKEKEKYHKSLSKQHEMKTDYENTISLLQNEKSELEANIKLCKERIKDLADELRRYKGISVGKKTEIFENENDKSKVLTEMQAKCQKTSQQIHHLEKLLSETSQELKSKEEEIKDIEFSYKKKLSNIEAENISHKKKCQSLEKSNEINGAKFNKISDMNKKLQTELAEKEKQIHLQKEQKQHLLNQMRETENKLETKIGLQKKEIQSLESELKLCKEAYRHQENAVDNNNSGRKEKKVTLEMDQRKKIAELKEQLKTVMAKLKETEAELAETKTRLSKAMGDRLTDNNPNITDLSDRNRPTKLAEKFTELYDNQWTDAFDVLEKSFQSEECVINALLQILQDVLSFCEKRATTQMETLGLELQLADKHGRGDVAADVRKLLKDCRKAVGMGALRNLQAMYQSHLKHSTNEILKTALNVKEFTSECVEICWFMVIQDPPVAFAPLIRKGSNFDNDFYKPYTSSGTRVDFPVWPPLLLHKGGPILAKGVAQGCSRK